VDDPLSTQELVAYLSPLIAGLATAVLVLAWEVLGSRRAAVAIGSIGMFLAAGLAAWSSQVHEARLLLDVAAAGDSRAILAGWVFGLTGVALLAGLRSLSSASSGAQVAALAAFTGSMSVVLLSSFDIALTLIALETLALAAYALVALGDSDAADEAAMKYFVQGALVAGLLVFGVAVAYGVFGGTTDYFAIASGLRSVPAELVDSGAGGKVMPPLLPAALLTLAFAGSAFFFKLGAFPLHSWVPDAYETARPSAAATMSAGPKIAVLAAMIVLLVGVFQGQAAVWTKLIAGIAVASMIFGNFGALRQMSYQRMLGYSGIAQVGYALIGFVGIARGPEPILLFAITYAMAVTGAFVAVDAVRETNPAYDGSIQGLAGLGRERPWLGAAMSACMFSLTGIPLTAGFWGKFAVFSYAVYSGWEWLAVVGAIASVVSFGYYGRVMMVMYFERPTALHSTEGAEEGTGGVGPASAALVGVALLIVAIGVIPLLTGLDSVLGLLAL
jgi:NADH-quinone oxidoreductase subunit N